MKTLPIPHYSLRQAATALDSDEEEILSFAYARRLPAYVENKNWEVEYHCAYWNDQGQLAYTVEYDSPKEFLRLNEDSIEQLINEQRINNAVFIWRSENNQEGGALRPHDFSCFSSRSNAIPKIGRKELLFLAEDVNNFRIDEAVLSANNKGYTTPYLELMKQAIDEYKITSEDQGNVDSLTWWFKSKKVAGTDVSGRLAQAMATLIRLPTSQAGSAKPNKKAKI